MEHNDEFEVEVRRALGRVDAPQGFAGRVATRARQQSQPRKTTRFFAPAWRMGYAAAAMLAITGGSVYVRHVQESGRRTTEAQQQFAKAMGLTGHALDRVTAQLQRGQIGQITSVLENER